MEYTVPHYYRNFQCIAGACPATCCAGWEIVIDNNMQEQYRKYPGRFGDRLRHSIDWKEGIFRQHGTRCAFLNKENLCDIYAEAGSGMLCRTCRRYPRHYEEFENLREISLSVSCPEVARMLLDMKQTVTFETVCRDGEEESYEEFDFFLFTKLQDERELMFDIAQNRSLPLRLRMSLVLAVSHDVQGRIRRQKLYEVDALLERYKRLCEHSSVSGLERLFMQRVLPNGTRQTGDIPGVGECVIRQAMFRSLYRLEMLHRDWKPDLKKWERILFGAGEEEYERVKRAFYRKNPDWEVQGEQLLIYFLFTYFCGAVYDEDAFGKAKAAVVHAMLLEDIFAAELALHGGRYSRKWQERCLYRYAREVEHSDRNLRRVEEYMNHDRIFSMDRLLKALWT